MAILSTMVSAMASAKISAILYLAAPVVVCHIKSIIIIMTIGADIGEDVGEGIGDGVGNDVGDGIGLPLSASVQSVYPSVVIVIKHNQSVDIDENWFPRASNC